MLMCEKGVDNVRGGPLLWPEAVPLASGQRSSLFFSLRHGVNRCTKCGGGHFANGCTKKTDLQRLFPEDAPLLPPNINKRKRQEVEAQAGSSSSSSSNNSSSSSSSSSGGA